ncbi:MAG: MaoC family dehydratase N-terminal domain-containing protein [Bacillota bacterium]|uniref:MaoC family dehydratase N-terminal domain-containing protein n=1 Tax=Desulfurispora thermophila TaxID=265470 RepID=UPI0003623FE7|nr:MaoC family dehydratase N-terminal domain-containing protein [Desulfurispora thermophila]
MEQSSLVGSKLPAFTFQVEKVKIREFALAVDDLNPLYLDSEAARQAGYRDVLAPPTFGICADFWGSMDFMSMCQFLQMNPVRVLHGEQEFVYHAPVCAGDELTVETVVESDTVKKSLRLVVLASTYSNQYGEMVLESRKLIIERL